MPRRLKIVLLTVLVGLAIGARILPGPRTIDDAFITFRYARNLLAGDGPVFNPGERVLGTTTPLYMGILAVAAAPFGPHAPYPEIALLLNALADALTCLLLVAVGRELKFETAGWIAALAWAVAPQSVTFAIGGLETSVYILLLLAVFYFRLKGRMVWTGIAAGLALLTRPDALLLILPVLADVVLRPLAAREFKKAALSLAESAGPLVLVYLPWAVFATLYYGSPLPHSMLAKSLAYRLDSGAGLVRLIQQYATPFFENLVLGMTPVLALFVFYLFLTVLAIYGARKIPGAWTGLAYPWLYFVTFAAANPLIFRWYLAPPMPFYYLGILAGLGTLLGMAGSALQFRKPAAWIFFAAVLFWFACSLRAWDGVPDHGPARPAPDMAWIRLELLYRKAADELAPQLKPGDVIAAGDVGVLGYYTGARILDTVGLNSPEATGYFPLPASMYAINYAIPPDLILDRRPEYLVALDIYLREGLLRDPRFASAYTPCAEYPTDIYGSRALMVYCRRTSP